MLLPLGPTGTFEQRTIMTSASDVGEGPIRWGMLAVISLAIMALTLNWFDVATAFRSSAPSFTSGLGR